MALTKQADIIGTNRTEDYIGAPVHEHEMSIGPGVTSMIIQQLTDLYTNPIEAMVRETVSNAIDATVRARNLGQDASDVEIVRPTELSPVLRIIDHGTGMNQDELEKYFSDYGNSTKLDDFTAIGSKGLGAKAMLAYTPVANIITVKDGVRVIAQMERGEYRNVLKTLSVKDTTESNGTTITITIQSKDIDSVNRAINRYATFSSDSTPLVIDGEKHSLSEHYFKMKDIVIGVDNDGKPVLGGLWFAKNTNGAWYDVPVRHLYETQLKSLHNWNDYPSSYSVGDLLGKVNVTLNGWNYSLTNNGISPWFVIEIVPGLVDFPASRDEIKRNKRFNELKSRILKGMCLDNDGTMGVEDFVNLWRNVPREARGSMLDYLIDSYAAVSPEALRPWLAMASKEWPELVDGNDGNYDGVLAGVVFINTNLNRTTRGDTVLITKYSSESSSVEYNGSRFTHYELNRPHYGKGTLAERFNGVENFECNPYGAPEVPVDSVVNGSSPFCELSNSNVYYLTIVQGAFHTEQEKSKALKTLRKTARERAVTDGVSANNGFYLVDGELDADSLEALSKYLKEIVARRNENEASHYDIGVRTVFTGVTTYDELHRNLPKPKRTSGAKRNTSRKPVVKCKTLTIGNEGKWTEIRNLVDVMSSMFNSLYSLGSANAVFSHDAIDANDIIASNDLVVLFDVNSRTEGSYVNRMSYSMLKMFAGIPEERWIGRTVHFVSTSQASAAFMDALVGYDGVYLFGCNREGFMRLKGVRNGNHHKAELYRKFSVGQLLDVFYDSTPEHDSIPVFSKVLAELSVKNMSTVLSNGVHNNHPSVVDCTKAHNDVDDDETESIIGLIGKLSSLPRDLYRETSRWLNTKMAQTSGEINELFKWWSIVYTDLANMIPYIDYPATLNEGGSLDKADLMILYDVYAYDFSGILASSMVSKWLEGVDRVFASSR